MSSHATASGAVHHAAPDSPIPLRSGVKSRAPAHTSASPTHASFPPAAVRGESGGGASASSNDSDASAAASPSAPAVDPSTDSRLSPRSRRRSRSRWRRGRASR